MKLTSFKLSIVVRFLAKISRLLDFSTANVMLN